MTVSFRNRDGKLVDVPEVTASRLKNEFGSVFEQAAADGAVVITKHDTPRAVLLSYAEFEALDRLGHTRARRPERALRRRCWPPCRQPDAKAGVAAAFDASPEEMGAAAVKAARSA